MPTSYRCPVCGQVGEVEDSLAGQKIKCPACESWIDVAATPELEEADDFVSMAELQEARRNESFADEARANQAIEQQRELLAESRKQTEHLKKIADNTGCIFFILAIWLILAILGLLATLASA